MKKKSATFRFYEELNDFLPPTKHKVDFEHRFEGNPAIKDIIEAIGIPHTEVDMILVNSNSVGFDYQLKEGDRVSVYPVFESLNISTVSRVRRAPLRELRFILDVHLGKLAKKLRLLGFDTLYSNDFDDEEIINISVQECRIILTRDRGLLKNKRVTHGYWLRSHLPGLQVQEVIRRFDLFVLLKPFTRCLACNGEIVPVKKENIIAQLPPKTRKYFREFYQCPDCRKIYWEGSHYQKMVSFITEFHNIYSKREKSL